MNELGGYDVEDLRPGMHATYSKTITEADDHLFCMITMNHHPLHTNDWFAEQSVQGRNVVVGNLVYSLVLGMSVPDVSGAALPTSVGTPALPIAMDVDQRLSVFALLTGTSIVAGCTVLIIAWRQMHQEPVVIWWAGSVLAHALASVLLLAGFGWGIAPLIIAGSALTTLGATAGWLALSGTALVTATEITPGCACSRSMTGK